MAAHHRQNGGVHSFGEHRERPGMGEKFRVRHPVQVNFGDSLFHLGDAGFKVWHLLAPALSERETAPRFLRPGESG